MREETVPERKHPSPQSCPARERGQAALAELDLRGLKCPLPVLRTRRALRRLAPGARLAVICTDPLAGVDIPNLVREEGDRIERQAREGEAFRFVIRRSPAD